MPISTIPVKWLNSQSSHRTSRFEVVAADEPTCPFGHGGISNDINISSIQKSFAERGSPSLARARGSLVGRGIANPMSERTRGFEMLLRE